MLTTSLSIVNNQLPEPTAENWDIQILWIGEQLAKTYDNEITAKGIREKVKTFVGQLRNMRGVSPYYVIKEWDRLILFRYKAYLETLQQPDHPSELSTYSVHTYFFVVRMMMTYAYSVLEILDEPVIVPAWKIIKKRKSEAHSAFETNRYEAVIAVLKLQTRKLTKYVQPYVRQGLGEDPRGRPDFYYGSSEWDNLDNFVWFFENLLDCKHHFYLGAEVYKIPGIYNFLGSKQFGYRTGIYELLGVAPATSDVIFPFIGLLAAETGLNPRSLFDLDIDCLDENISAVCGRPCLIYQKPRSGGEKVLAIDDAAFGDIDNQEQPSDEIISVNNEDLSIFWLSSIKAKRVKNIVTTVMAINSAIREMAPPELSRKLFLYWVKDHCGTRGPAIPSDTKFKNWVYGNFKPAVVNYIVGQMKATTTENQWESKELELREELKSESFSLKRFRATLATRLAEDGAPIELIQLVLGHESIKTTIAYIERNSLQVRFYREMSEHLDTIMRNAATYKGREDNKESNSQEGSPNGMPFQCGVGQCKDPFNPPSEIKKSLIIQEGERCTCYERCLLECKNLIITFHSLPKLITIKREANMRLNSQLSVPGRHIELFLKRIAVRRLARG